MSKSVSVLALVMLGMTCLLHVTRAQPAPAASEAQARLFDEDISELEGQPLIEYNSRQPRKRSDKKALRGVARHKQANKKLYPKKKHTPLRHPGDVDRIFALDEYDPLEELPEPSTLPWIQLATLGTFIAGMNVVFGQMLLDIKEKPNLPFPFGLNRYGRDLSRQTKFGNSSIDTFETTMRNTPEPSCAPQMLCETRQLMTYVPSFERIIQTYGLSLNGLSPDYRTALENGATRKSCKAGRPLCTPSFVTWLLEAAKAVERLWPIEDDVSLDFETEEDEIIQPSEASADKSVQNRAKIQ